MESEVDNFFREKPIAINVETQDTEETTSYTVFMRPIKVKDLSILNRIVYLQEDNPEDVQAAGMLLELVTSTLHMESDILPIEATSKLISYFIEYNFPKEVKKVKTDKEKAEDEKRKKLPKKEPKNINGLLGCFDFLISQGHIYSDIMEYSLPDFNDFVTTAAERLGIKKKPMDAVKAFQKLGIPVKK